MKLYTHLILAVAALFLFAACSDDDSTATSAPTGQDISGTYTKSCANDGGTGSWSVTISISSGTITITVPTYVSVNDCTGTADYTESTTTTIAFNDATTLGTGEAVSRVTLTDTASTITPATDAGATSLAGKYGIATWTTGTAQSIIGVNEDGSTSSSTELNVLYVNDTASPNTLTFGNTNSTLDGDGYPATLETDTFSKS